jgi:hypothetical protein
MLTLDALRSSSVNVEIAKEALAQAEKRLNDALDAKKAADQKATVLFGAYVTISLALFGFAGALLKDAGQSANAWPFFIAGLVFVFGAMAFASVFRTAEYGNLGSEPSMWLQAGRIDGDNDELGRMFAYLAHHHAGRIRVSYESNAAKDRALNVGMLMGLFGSIALFAATFVIFVGSASHP